jgi:hypothetical protein
MFPPIAITIAIAIASNGGASNGGAGTGCTGGAGAVLVAVTDNEPRRTHRRYAYEEQS